jgi:hypothetical protein
LRSIPKGIRVTGDARTKLAAELVKRYEKGASVRGLADSIGRSYGFIHRILNESGVKLRSRGGSSHLSRILKR